MPRVAAILRPLMAMTNFEVYLGRQARSDPNPVAQDRTHQKYERIQKPWLIPTSLPGRPSKIAPDTPVVMRNPNQTRKPTMRPPAIPFGSPATLASLRSEERRVGKECQSVR